MHGCSGLFVACSTYEEFFVNLLGFPRDFSSSKSKSKKESNNQSSKPLSNRFLNSLPMGTPIEVIHKLHSLVATLLPFRYAVATHVTTVVTLLARPLTSYLERNFGSSCSIWRGSPLQPPLLHPLTPHSIGASVCVHLSFALLQMHVHCIKETVCFSYQS